MNNNNDKNRISPYFEARAAWRPRVDLPHNLFEVLFKKHMQGGVRYDGYEAFSERAVQSARLLTAHIDQLAQAQPGLSRDEIARSFPQDGLFAEDIGTIVAKPLTPLPQHAQRAWAGLVVTAALEPHLPKNFWCAAPNLYDAFSTAITDAREAGSYFFASELSAYHRMQLLNTALPVVARAFARDEKSALHLVARPVFSGLHANMHRLRTETQAVVDAHMNAPGVIPFRPR